jgi:hypothetical protein
LVLVGILLEFYSQIPTENLVGKFWYQKIGGSPFFLPKGGLGPLFDALSTSLEEKMTSRRFFQIKSPAKSSKKSSHQILEYKNTN